LTVDEKNDMSMLVNNITDKMMKQIAKIFDSPPVSPATDDEPPHSWIPSFLQKENKAPTPKPVPQVPSASQGSPKPYSRAHEIIEKEENEAMTPQLSELKKEALAFFAKWRTGLMTRIRELKVSEQAPSPAPAGRGARGGIRGGRGMPRGRGVPLPARGRGGRGGRLTVQTPSM
jgi:hypothetical protein